MGGVTCLWLQSLRFFPPNPPSYKLVKDEATGIFLLDSFPRRENVDVLRLPTRRGTKIVAVYVRYPMAKSTLLYSHGNAANVGQMYELFIKLSEESQSDRPSEQNTYADSEAAYKCLEESYGAKQENIILYGLRVMYPVKHTYWFDIYKNIDKISLIKCHVLIFLGSNDDVVDCSHGKQLWELCQEKYEPLWIKGGNHCDLELYPEYVRHLRKFISTVEKSPSQRNGCRRSTDGIKQFEAPRKDADSRDKPRKSSDSIDKPRKSTDRPEKLKFYEYNKLINIDKQLRTSLDQMEGMERSRRSMEYHDKSRRSVDRQLEKLRKSVAWLDRIRAV